MADAYAIVYLVIYGGYTLILLAVAGLGLWLLRYPAQKSAGIVILVLLAVWSLGPPTYDRVIGFGERRAVDAATLLPEALSFEGQRVLVIEAGNGICSDFCGDLLQLGVPGEFYWIGIGHYTGAEDVPNPDFAILNHGDRILRVVLGPPQPDLDGMRFAEAVEGAVIPPFDMVLIDDNGYLRSYAPQLLGLPDALLSRTQIARVGLEDWADPFADPPPAPIYRSVAPWQNLRAFVYWPLARNDSSYPPLHLVDAAWNALICAEAGPSEDRDAFTHAFLCDPDRLNTLF